MKGKKVLITGATDGIGKKTAIELAKMGAELIIHGRNASRGSEVVDLIKKETGNQSVQYFNADLSSLTRVKSFATAVTDQYDRLDVLINNAGVFSREHNFSSDRIEISFAVNHLSHFLLTLHLLPLLLRSSQGRVVTVSSIAHNSSPRVDFSDLQEINSYMDYSAYALSKLANVLFANELADRLKDTRITSNSLHPGVISTKLLHAGFGISGDTLEEGSKTSVYLATAKELSNVSGKYFSNSTETAASELAHSKVHRKNLWFLSEKLCDVQFDDFI